MNNKDDKKSPSIPLRVGIVGSGLIATKKHIPSILKIKNKLNLVAICDPNIEIAKKVAKENNINKTYSSLNDMLDNEKLDFVDICTPPFTHSEIAIKSIQAGCNVMIEKPMAITVDECDKIINAAKQFDKKICVAHSDLFYPPFIKARSLVSNGEIGDFMGMRIFLSTPTSYMTIKEDHWANKLPGGVIGETGPHLVYMTLAFMNKIKNVKSYALKQLDYKWSPYEDYRIDLIGNDNRSSSIVSVYSSNQWFAQVDVWGTKGLLNIDLETMNLNIHNRKTLNRLDVAKSGLNESINSISNIFQTGIKSIFGSYKNTHDYLIEGFADSIISDTESPVPAEDGREAVRVMKLIVENFDKKKVK